MKQSKYLFIFFLWAVINGVSATSIEAQIFDQPKRETPDKIRIVDVIAVAPIVDGAANVFTVTIEYTLESTDEASVAIGFNAFDSGSFRMLARKKVKRGANTITLKAKVVPKDWQESGDFSVLANLSPYPLPSARYSPMAGTEMVIEFAQ